MGVGRFWDALSSPHWGSRPTDCHCTILYRLLGFGDVIGVCGEFRLELKQLLCHHAPLVRLFCTLDSPFILRKLINYSRIIIHSLSYLLFVFHSGHNFLKPTC